MCMVQFNVLGFVDMILRLSLLLLIRVAGLNVFASNTDVQLILQIVPVNDPNCVGGPVAGLTNTSVLVQYRLRPGDNTQWIYLADIGLNETFDGTLQAIDVQDRIQFRLLQLEHGGGVCNCWDIESFRLRDVDGNSQLMAFDFNQTDVVDQYLCNRSGPGVIPGSRICGGDRGRDARGIVTKVFNIANNGGVSVDDECPDNPGGGLVSTMDSIRVDDITCDSRIIVSYQLILDVSSPTDDRCDGLDFTTGGDRSREAIEFAMRDATSSDGDWIPLWLSYYVNNIFDATSTFETVRGYQQITTGRSVSPIITETVAICGETLSEDSEIQFRWMGSADMDTGNYFRQDMWALASVNVTVDGSILFSETFGNSALNSSVWMTPRRGSVNCEVCEDTVPCANHYLTFGAYDGCATDDVATMIAVTNTFSLRDRTVSFPDPCLSAPCDANADCIRDGLQNSDFTCGNCRGPYIVGDGTTCSIPDLCMPDPCPMGQECNMMIVQQGCTEAANFTCTVPDPCLSDPCDTNADCTREGLLSPNLSCTCREPFIGDGFTCSGPFPALSAALSFIQERLDASELLRTITNPTVPDDALSSLLERLEDGVEIIVVLYILGRILDELDVDTLNNTEEFVETFLEIGSIVIERNVLGQLDVDPAVVGATLLDVMDELAYRVFEDTGNVTTKNIILQETQIPTDEGGLFTTIDSTDFVSDQPAMSIQIPTELVGMFEESDGRAVSYLYFGVEELFPSGLGNNSTLESGIVSTALQCGTGRCPTENMTLNTPVMVTIQHSTDLQTILAEESDFITTCVFWDFLDFEGSEDTVLSTGQWSDRGCSRNERLSNVSVTVCECDHLTHFAILLSPAPINASADVLLSLEIIGYVGVSVSLVAMVATITTFILLKSLRNMRNYIHINLCISLGIAQIIFVAGIDQSSPGDVPIHCQAIAVLLHYFFLVSFMWMLMEGVVLYVVLVRVFVKRTKMYMLAFTLASYGIPLLYLGVLTLPLGFALDERPHYGYNQACFLSPMTRFIWAFISPVILIILLNFVFLIIVARVMWRHQKKFTENTQNKNIRKWLRAAFSLVVIMGLTWIFGVLIVEVEALLPLAYIYTILVAFQGLWIFLIFVLLSPQVRDAYKKWWRAKVNESDFLSKYFSDSLKTSMGNSSMPKAKSDIAPSSMELEEKATGQNNSTVAPEVCYSNCDSPAVLCESPMKKETELASPNVYAPYRSSNAFRLPVKQSR